MSNITLPTFTTYTITQLNIMSVTKGDLFENYKGVYDTALPQLWLDLFAKYCEKIGYINYDLIRSTTVWTYPSSDAPYLSQGPVSACEEVQQAIEYFDFCNQYGEQSERLLWAIMTDAMIYEQMILELGLHIDTDTVKAFCKKMFKSLDESKDSYLTPHIDYEAIAGKVLLSAMLENHK
jgi:hypothetical protein